MVSTNSAMDLEFLKYQRRPRKVDVVIYDGTKEQEKALIHNFPTLFCYYKRQFICACLGIKTPAINDLILFDFDSMRPRLVNILSKQDFEKYYEPQETCHAY